MVALTKRALSFSSSFCFWHIGQSGGSYEEPPPPFGFMLSFVVWLVDFAMGSALGIALRFVFFSMRGFRFLNSPLVGRRPNMGRELGTGRVSKDLPWPRGAPDHVRRCRSIANHMAKHSTFGMPTRGTMFCIGQRLLVSWVGSCEMFFRCCVSPTWACESGEVRRGRCQQVV